MKVLEGYGGKTHRLAPSTFQEGMDWAQAINNNARLLVNNPNQQYSPQGSFSGPSGGQAPQQQQDGSFYQSGQQPGHFYGNLNTQQSQQGSFYQPSSPGGFFNRSSHKEDGFPQGDHSFQQHQGSFQQGSFQQGSFISEMPSFNTRHRSTSKTGQDLSFGPPPPPSYYDIISINKNTTTKLIRKKHRGMKAHLAEDHSHLSLDQQQRMQDITAAFEILTSEPRRREYDSAQSTSHALRGGVLVDVLRPVHFPAMSPWVKVALFVDSEYTALFWQDPMYGLVLDHSYETAKLLDIQWIFPGNEGGGLDKCPEGLEDRILTVRGSKIHSQDTRFLFPSSQARDKMLSALKVICTRHSPEFRSNLEMLHLSMLEGDADSLDGYE